MSAWQHDWRSLAPDYLRGGLVFATALVPVFGFPLAPPVFWIFSAIAALAFLHVCRTVLRHRAVIECDDNGISVSGPLGKRIPWTDLSDMQLNWYSARRDGKGGWMQLRVAGPQGRIRIESTLTGFADIVFRAADAARSRGIDLSPTTLGNLQVLGRSSRFSRRSAGPPTDGLR